MDVLIMLALVGLGGRGKEGLRELLRLDQTGGHLDTVDGLRLLVLGPSRSYRMLALRKI